MSRQYRSGYGYNSGGGSILCTGEGDGLNGGYATNDGSGSGFGSGSGITKTIGIGYGRGSGSGGPDGTGECYDCGRADCTGGQDI